jgi:hypothetical protein
MKTYRIKDWAKHYETAETRKLVSMRWVPVPNKHDGKGFRRLMRRPDGLEVFAIWILILQVASREEQRGLLEDQDGPLGVQEIADKTGAPEQAIEKALQVLASKEIGWLEVIESTGIPGDPPETPGPSPERMEGNGREWKGMDGGGSVRTVEERRAPSAAAAAIMKFAPELPAPDEDGAEEILQLAAANAPPGLNPVEALTQSLAVLARAGRKPSRSTVPYLLATVPGAARSLSPPRREPPRCPKCAGSGETRIWALGDEDAAKSTGGPEYLAALDRSRVVPCPACARKQAAAG